MNVSSVTTFGSAAIASPPANNPAAPKPDENAEAPPSPAQQIIEVARENGPGQVVDIKV